MKGGKVLNTQNNALDIICNIIQIMTVVFNGTNIFNCCYLMFLMTSNLSMVSTTNRNILMNSELTDILYYQITGKKVILIIIKVIIILITMIIIIIIV